MIRPLLYIVSFPKHTIKLHFIMLNWLNLLHEVEYVPLFPMSNEKEARVNPFPTLVPKEKKLKISNICVLNSAAKVT